jgi:hypothetical protein
MVRMTNTSISPVRRVIDFLFGNWAWRLYLLAVLASALGL